MQMDGIELRFKEEFWITQKGTVEGKLSLHNQDQIDCIRRVRSAFHTLYEEGGKEPGLINKKYFNERFMHSKIYTPQMIGKVLACVVPHQSNSKHNWRWRHPMEIVLGCTALLKAMGVEE